MGDEEGCKHSSALNTDTKPNPPARNTSVGEGWDTGLFSLRQTIGSTAQSSCAGWKTGSINNVPIKGFLLKSSMADQQKLGTWTTQEYCSREFLKKN